jgi:hypothetical protein
MAPFTLWQLLNQRQPFPDDESSEAAQQQPSTGQAIGQSLIDFWNHAQADSSPNGNWVGILPQSDGNIDTKIIAPGLLPNDDPDSDSKAIPVRPPATNLLGEASVPRPAALPVAWAVDHSSADIVAPGRFPRSAGDIGDGTMQRMMDYLEQRPGVPDDQFPPETEIRKRQVEGDLQGFDSVGPRASTAQDRENYEYATNPEYKALFDKFDEFLNNYGRLPSGTAYLRQELKKRLHGIYGVPNYETDEPAYERDSPWIAKWKFNQQKTNHDI